MMIIIILTILGCLSSSINSEEFPIYDVDDMRGWLQPRIAGGYPASLCEVHYQVSVQLRGVNDTYTPRCGGVLISLDHVLTMASCLYTTDVNGATVPLQPNDLRCLSEITGTNASFFGQFRYPEDYVKHEDFVLGGLDYDLAVIRVNRSFINTFYSAPIPLRRRSSTTGEYCTVSGFGGFVVGGLPSQILYRAIVPIADHAKCVETYAIQAMNVTNNMICAGDEGRNFCSGDVGGPLVCNGEVAGMAIFGINCGDPQYPNVLLEISKFAEWIINQMAVLK